MPRTSQILAQPAQPWSLPSWSYRDISKSQPPPESRLTIRRRYGRATDINRVSPGVKILAAFTVLLTFFLWSNIRAQEMEPRAYSRAPVGTQFVLMTYGYQTGDVLTDASLPLKDVEA